MKTPKKFTKNISSVGRLMLFSLAVILMSVESTEAHPQNNPVSHKQYLSLKKESEQWKIKLYNATSSVPDDRIAAAIVKIGKNSGDFNRYALLGYFSRSGEEVTSFNGSVFSSEYARRKTILTLEKEALSEACLEEGVIGRCVSSKLSLGSKSRLMRKIDKIGRNLAFCKKASRRGELVAARRVDFMTTSSFIVADYLKRFGCSDLKMLSNKKPREIR